MRVLRELMRSPSPILRPPGSRGSSTRWRRACGTGLIVPDRCGESGSPSRADRRSARWVLQRRRHSAASSSDDLGFVVVTHPFHALSGQRLEVLFVKRRGGDSVFVCSGGVSGQMTVPRSWTDRGVEPGGRRLSAEGLAELFAVTRAIQGR
jgi:Family of unknown function (DUF5372)